MRVHAIHLGYVGVDTFGARAAAVGDDTADTSLAHATGSMAVNTFVGLGLSWSIACIYHQVSRALWELRMRVQAHGDEFKVDPGTLAYAITLLVLGAIVVTTILQIRRYSSWFGRAEFGGPVMCKFGSMLAFWSVWVTYIVMSFLESNGYIDATKFNV
jgi:solute carrier family 8 (sodium/calcium exchanger)